MTAEVARPGHAWRVPAALAAIASRLPPVVPSAALAAALSLAVHRGLDPELLARLHRRVLRVVVDDAGLTLTVRCERTRVVPDWLGTRADVTISSSLRDFLLLATRREDPDTLFFARRLRIEGDTDTGLAVKNLLDAADLSPLIARLERAIGLIGALRAAPASPSAPSRRVPTPTCRDDGA